MERFPSSFLTFCSRSSEWYFSRFWGFVKVFSTDVWQPCNQTFHKQKPQHNLWNVTMSIRFNLNQFTKLYIIFQKQVIASYFVDRKFRKRIISEHPSLFFQLILFDSSEEKRWSSVMTIIFNQNYFGQPKVKGEKWCKNRNKRWGIFLINIMIRKYDPF